MKIEFLAVFWMMIGMLIISMLSRQVLAVFFADMPKFIRRSIPFHLFYYGMKNKIDKWLSSTKEDEGIPKNAVFINQ
jgi:hypothetical protein